VRESVQEERTREILEGRHAIAYRKDGRQGWPDRIALLGDGAHCWVEHKTPRGRPTPAQRRVFPKLEAAGDVIIYGRGRTAEEIVAEILRHARPGFARDEQTGVSETVDPRDHP